MSVLKSVKKKKKINIWFFTGRSIGVTLLGIYALESAASRHKEDYEVSLFLVFSEKGSVYQELLHNHTNIEPVYLESKNFSYALHLLRKYFFYHNLFLYPPSFGRPPLLARMFSKLLTLGHKKSSVTGYVDIISNQDKFLYDKAIVVDLHQNIFSAVKNMSDSDKQFNAQPSLLFSVDAQFEQSLPEKYVVLHPFAASQHRSYPRLYTIKLIQHLREKFPDYTILISGSPADKKLFVEWAVDLEEQIIFMEDFTSGDFSRTMQIIAGADLYIGVDTGITHMAAHFQTPVIELANNSNPMWLPTYNPNVAILKQDIGCTCTGDKKGGCLESVDGCNYYRCMVTVPWQDVTSAVESFLNE